MMLTDDMCHEKKEEEDLPALKIALMHRYDDTRLNRKRQRKTDYSDPKQDTRHKNQ